jgi:DNA polymerase III delta prime subunit
MLQSTTMTYLIVGNNSKNTDIVVRNLLEKLWKREIKEDLFFSKNPDIHILDGREVNSIGIEEVKKLQQEMMYTPFQELVQIAFILDAKKLTSQAQNSFLKTLEESSNSTAYILIVDNDRSLLPTILSRCLKIYTKDEREQSIEDISKEFLDLNLVEAFRKIEMITKEKSDTENFLKNLELYLQQQLETSIENGGELKSLSLDIQQVLLAQRRIKANGNKRLVLENLYLHLTR